MKNVKSLLGLREDKNLIQYMIDTNQDSTGEYKLRLKDIDELIKSEELIRNIIQQVG